MRSRRGGTPDPNSTDHWEHLVSTTLHPLDTLQLRYREGFVKNRGLKRCGEEEYTRGSKARSEQLPNMTSKAARTGEE